jgi:hypothetical protein
VLYPDIFRVQAVFQGKSGLPEDRFVNTWHFRNDAGIGTGADAVAAMVAGLNRFYFEAPAAGKQAVGAFIQRDVIDSIQYRGYDLGLDEPRAPIIVPGPSPLPPTLATGPLVPSEAAVVLSFGSAVIPPKTGTPGKRGQGRLYIGPVNGNACKLVAGVVRVETLLQDSLTLAFKKLQLESGFTTVVLSPTYQQTDVVTKCWVDDAFDTQRKRGPAPLTRVALQV